MRNRFTIFLAAFILPLFAAAPAAAQTLLSLEECISLAKENNSSLSAARSSRDASEYDFKSVRGNFYPSLSISGAGLYSTADGSLAIPGGNLPVFDAAGVPTGSTAYFPGLGIDYKFDWIFQGGVMLKQPLYMGGKIRSGYKMAKSAAYIAEQNIRVTEAEVVVETSKAYMNAVRAKELKIVAEKYNALVQNLLKDVQSAYRHGLVPKNDLLKVEVRLNESNLAMKRAENAQRLATMNLCHAIGRPLTEKIEVNETIPQYEALPDADAAITGRPEFMMLEQKSELAKRQIKMARSESLPQLALVGSYGYMHGLKLNDASLFGGWDFTAGVTLSIPIFNFGVKANKVRAAKARYEQTLSEVEDANELMTLEVTLAANNLDEAILEQNLAKVSLETATENLRMSESQYKAGVEQLTDLLEAQLMWQQAEQQFIDANIGAYVKWIEYQKATGNIN